MPLSEHSRSRILERLRFLYGDQAKDVLRRIDQLADRYATLRDRPPGSLWDQRSVVLITYGDQIRNGNIAALEAQRQFLLDYNLDDVISNIHILPFFPYSSDDGFSVIDYRQVNPEMGNWSDVDRLGESFGMAFDLVVNHCSQQHDWFQQYLKGEEPCIMYFIDADPSTDLSSVTRPRSSPLLTSFETERGTKHVWTTFSADQVDLNFACPDVLLEMLSILLSYIQYGARTIRLDAIGFLWKKIGTTCMHLPETHAVVKLMRALTDDLAPGTILLSETNVPHDENISYFGEGDEAHIVYQFSLAPLLLDAFLTGDADPLNAWLSGLEFPGDAMTYFNFTASHDGIGVRPLEKLISQERLETLVECVRDRGGLVSMRRNPDGTESPYELNISYVSAMDSPEGLSPDDHARKFLASQGLMLALRGVPGIYFHSLVGTQNYTEGVEETGHNRTINRRKFNIDELRRILSDENSVQSRISEGYRRMLKVRITQPAFHPDAKQAFWDTDNKSIVAFRRSSQNGSQQILVIVNVGAKPVSVNLEKFNGVEVTEDLLSGKRTKNGIYEIAAHDIAWLT